VIRIEKDAGETPFPQRLFSVPFPVVFWSVGVSLFPLVFLVHALKCAACFRVSFRLLRRFRVSTKEQRSATDTITAHFPSLKLKAGGGWGVSIRRDRVYSRRRFSCPTGAPPLLFQKVSSEAFSLDTNSCLGGKKKQAQTGSKRPRGAPSLGAGNAEHNFIDIAFQMPYHGIIKPMEVRRNGEDKRRRKAEGGIQP
jgi:hypothetical protein